MAGRLRGYSFGRIEPIVCTAYDAEDGVTRASHDNMTPDLWVNYADRVRATHWFELFPEGDGRRLLTWKDRFAAVTNVVNFYSTQENVVCNGDGTLMPYGSAIPHRCPEISPVQDCPIKSGVYEVDKSQKSRKALRGLGSHFQNWGYSRQMPR